jgi:multidrug resistance efflux pump
MTIIVKRNVATTLRSAVSPAAGIVHAATRHVEQRQASVDQLKAQLTGAKWNLDKTECARPADGYVTNVALRKGARVANLPLTSVMAFIDTADTLIGTLK